ncbi:hypothetical protein CWE07_13000 [Aliidiomarina maris]|uniref:Pilus assembly protein CpaC n=2 Tax=Aliidiomarina maris TaxID=531312 RepID=A0ABY0BNS9_9GAMM|nr:hypothetical protein CWE07_13000 [Aliidiomarina maris]
MDNWRAAQFGTCEPSAHPASDSAGGMVMKWLELQLPGRALTVLVSLLMLVWIGAASAQDESTSVEHIYLDIGALHVLPVAGVVTRVAVGLAEIVEVRQIEPSAILLVGRQLGSSDVQVWTGSRYTHFRVHVGPLVEPDIAVAVIELEVQVLELKSRQLQSLGVRWQQIINGPNVGIVSDWVGGDQFRVVSEFATTPDFDTLGLAAGQHVYAGLAASFRSQLQALTEQGQARMLASPVLRTESGQYAEFLAGGEVPLPQVNAQGAMDVSFRQYGIGLQIRPQQLDDGAIRTHVITEVSNLDPAVSVQGIPGLLTRRTESVVAVQANETFVISGLRSEDNALSQEHVHGLAKLPVVGALFRYRQQQQQETELVIFITPRRVEDLSSRRQARFSRVQSIRQQLLQTPCRGMRDARTQ